MENPIKAADAFAASAADKAISESDVEATAVENRSVSSQETAWRADLRMTRLNTVFA